MYQNILSGDNMQYNREINKMLLKLNIHKLIISLIILFVILFFILKVFFIPRLIILGPTTIELNSTFTPKYEATNFFNNYKNKVVVKNTVDTSKEGNYEVTYSLKYLFLTITKKQIINVLYTKAPTLKLEGSQEVNLCPNAKFQEPGYSAYDEYYGDVTSKVKVFQNDNTITYEVKNRNGKKVTATRKINYVDTEIPTLTLQGSNPLILVSGTSYTEPGYNVTDNCTQNLSSKVQVSGTVNTNKVGEYKLTYTVKDDNNNSATATRIVKVISPETSQGIIYLTFDDGPSSTITPAILDILKEEGIKATFFVTDKSDSLNYLLLREKNEGHSLALHTASHNYAKIYTSETNFLQDLTQIHDKVYKVTGVDTKIIRFPGGASNTISKKYCPGIMSNLTKTVEGQGYTYFDWNVDSDDAGSAKTSQDVYKNVTTSLKKNRANVVLMHDFENNHKTLEALRDIINYGKTNGYVFKRITSNTEPIHHHVNN